ncbi:hypothetical protein GHT06_022723 [Daphnia sinensis]|uniref:Cuticle protein n=1 Tax=Daphnia sinensis TaxID=1820382 RepID=A0AAD5PNX5_9CRUS|nr:hypothetical protein GHT06_022723 [Daphnia sinensis]
MFCLDIIPVPFFVLVALIAVAAATSDYTGSANSNFAYNAPSYSHPTYEVKQYSSDSQVTTGTYRVLLPDGRVQIVTYKADDYGYNADVKYEGEAKYPAASYSAPVYSAPAYTSSAATATGPARPSSATVFTSPAVTAPAVSSRTYSTPVFISRPAVTATAGNSRTYSAPVITSPTITGPVVIAPDANSRSYSGQVFTSPVVAAPARPAMPSTASVAGSVYRTSADVARDY